MNIFYLDNHTHRCAKQHCDKHVVKMIIEYAQLMSTAHRVLDGDPYEGRTANGRRIARWKHPLENHEKLLKNRVTNQSKNYNYFGLQKSQF